MDPSHELSVPALAYRLGCNIPQAQGLIRTGRIPGRKTPSGWVTTEAALKTYLTTRSVNTVTSRVGGVGSAEEYNDNL